METALLIAIVNEADGHFAQWPSANVLSPDDSLPALARRDGQCWVGWYVGASSTDQNNAAP